MTLRRAKPFWGKKNNASSLPYTPPLDIFNNSIAAYSVRKLRSAYTGPCMKVGSTLLNGIDIGFDINGLLDISSISSAFPTSPVYLEKWYDQSGNGNDAIGSATLINRKLIQQNTGILVQTNSLPALGGKTSVGAANNNSLQLTNPIVLKSHFSVGIVRGSQTITYNGWGSSSNDGIFLEGSLAGINGMGIVLAGSVTALVGTTENFNQRLWEYIGGSPASVFVNGTLEDTATISDPTITEIGRSTEFGGGANFSIFGELQELIYFSDYKNSDRASIESNINSYFSIY